MNEQEVLFTAVRERFPAWGTEKCSGYVHGIVDEGISPIPDLTYVSRTDDYAVGYVLGYINARGEDVAQDAWISRWARDHHYCLTANLNFRWWAK